MADLETGRQDALQRRFLLFLHPTLLVKRPGLLAHDGSGLFIWMTKASAAPPAGAGVMAKSRFARQVFKAAFTAPPCNDDGVESRLPRAMARYAS